ncbi:MAG: 16S rRNA (guanine(527)-N(7))-methyltransferase RsmG [Pararhodobacter sp.]|nr:16S rRNA (guanine(527)-N(7))-methyltransferase RsmG [Pararhodobacter sp.]
MAPPYCSGDLAGVRVSRETWDRLGDYCDCLIKWSSAISLVSKAEESRLWQRHILDCAQLWPLRHPNTKSWADLGTGGGLPGVVVAIIARELSPDTAFHLVESDRRKAAFLRYIDSRQNLGFTLHAARLEVLPPIQAQTVSARALAPLPRLLGLVACHLAPGGIALLPKGQNLAKELQEAKRIWEFSLKQNPSKVDSRASILQITDIQPLQKPSP